MWKIVYFVVPPYCRWLFGKRREYRISAPIFVQFLFISRFSIQIDFCKVFLRILFFIACIYGNSSHLHSNWIDNTANYGFCICQGYFTKCIFQFMKKMITRMERMVDIAFRAWSLNFQYQYSKLFRQGNYFIHQGFLFIWVVCAREGK